MGALRFVPVAPSWRLETGGPKGASRAKQVTAGGYLATLAKLKAGAKPHSGFKSYSWDTSVTMRLGALELGSIFASGGNATVTHQGVPAQAAGDAQRSSSGTSAPPAYQQLRVSTQADGSATWSVSVGPSKEKAAAHATVRVPANEMEVLRILVRYSTPFLGQAESVSSSDG